MARIAVILLAIMCASACTEPRTKRCTDVCAREAACHDQLETHENFDEGECLDACAALERDAEAAKQVARHADCVKSASTCEQVVVCP
jgi:hypothetical protein